MTDRRCIVVDDDGRALVLRAVPDGEPVPFYGATIGAFGPCFEREGEAEPVFGHVCNGGPTFFSKVEAEMMIAFLHKGRIVEKTEAELLARHARGDGIVAQVAGLILEAETAHDLLSKSLDRAGLDELGSRLKRPKSKSNIVSLAARREVADASAVQGTSLRAGDSLTLSLVSKKTRSITRVELEGPATLKQVHLGRRFWMIGQGLTDDGELEDVPGAPDAKTVDEHTRIQFVVETTGAGTISARIV